MTPQIGDFSGWKVKMYFNDHNPPHIHLERNGVNIVVDFNGYILQGNAIDIDIRSLKKYVENNREILGLNWSNFVNGINEFKKLR